MKDRLFKKALVYTSASVLLSASTLMAVNYPVLDKRFGQWFSAHQDSKIKNQRERNVDKFYLKSFEDQPFHLGVFKTSKEDTGKTYALSKDVMGDYMTGIKSKWGQVLNESESFDNVRNGQWMKYFGAFNLWMPKDMRNPGAGLNNLFTVRHNQYIVGKVDGKPVYGVRVLPVLDGDKNHANNNIDKFLRYKMKLSESDPIFAPIYYFHGEYYEGNFGELKDKHRTDDGFTHMGAYIGDGQTRNAPYGYHGQQWELDGSYPANVVMVKYDFADSQAEFNRNAYVTLKLLNETGSNVIFSRLNYQQDYYQAHSLKEILDFYRGWMDPSWVRTEVNASGQVVPKDRYDDGSAKPFNEVIKEDKYFDTYCAEHITMVLNVALNLEQTKEGYIRTFGSDSDPINTERSAFQVNNQSKGGEWFWKMATQTWKDDIEAHSGEKMPQVATNSIIPLWKVDAQEAGSDLKSTLSQKGGATLVDEAGFAMAWAPLTLPGMVRQYMALYTPVDKMMAFPGGMDILLQTLYGFSEAVQARAPQLLTRDTANDFSVGSLMPKTFSNVSQIYYDAAKNFEDLIMDVSQKFKALDRDTSTATQQMNEIKSWFAGEIRNQLEGFSEPGQYGINVKEKDDNFWYYSPPPIINRILQGNHRHNKYVNFEILGTAFDAEQSDGEAAVVSDGYYGMSTTVPDDQGVLSVDDQNDNSHCDLYREFNTNDGVCETSINSQPPVTVIDESSVSLEDHDDQNDWWHDVDEQQTPQWDFSYYRDCLDAKADGYRFTNAERAQCKATIRAHRENRDRQADERQRELDGQQRTQPRRTSHMAPTVHRNRSDARDGQHNGPDTDRGEGKRGGDSVNDISTQD